MTAPSLLVASHNEGKLRELRDLLGNIPMTLANLNQWPNVKAVDETGATFAENASLKAAGYARQARLLTLADDSGLEVDVLGGRPGVLSARYAGVGASDQERTNKLLFELATVPLRDRLARFRCSVAIADEDGSIIHVSSGKCEGTIALAPKGSRGFGYDPIFIPNGFEETFAELGAEIKNRISHRTQALKGACAFLRSLTAASNAD